MNRKEVLVPLFYKNIFKEALNNISYNLGKVKQIKRLKGLSNLNFLLKIDNNIKYVTLKILKLNPVTQVNNEGIINKKFTKLNIYPEILINNFPYYYVLVHIKGKSATKDYFNVKENIHKLFNLINCIHDQLIFEPNIDFTFTNTRLLKELKVNKEVNNLFAKLDIWNLIQKKLPYNLAFCHNDLNLNNIIIDTNDKLWCIDFEYSGFGDIFFDLSSLYFNLKKDSYFYFLELYYKKKLPNLDFSLFHKKLSVFNILVLITSTIWYLYMSKKQKNKYYYYNNCFKKLYYKLNAEFNKIYCSLP